MLPEWPEGRIGDICYVQFEQRFDVLIWDEYMGWMIIASPLGQAPDETRCIERYEGYRLEWL